MISFSESVSISDLLPVIYSMRNSWESWHKGDSYVTEEGDFVLGENDKKLFMSLIKAGSSDSKFLRMINVTVDITAPLYWWKQYDTYKVGTVANSSSTMHRILSKEFHKDQFSTDGGANIDNLIEPIITSLNLLRASYMDLKSKLDMDPQVRIKMMKATKRAIIQLLPESYNQFRTVMFNYQTLLQIFKERRNHELSEWRSFCKITKNFPLVPVMLEAAGVDFEAESNN